jgi:hypothetical protein
VSILSAVNTVNPVKKPMTASSSSTINNHHSTIINPSFAMLCGHACHRSLPATAHALQLPAAGRDGFWTLLTGLTGLTTGPSSRILRPGRLGKIILGDLGIENGKLRMENY